MPHEKEPKNREVGIFFLKKKNKKKNEKKAQKYAILGIWVCLENQ